MCLKNRRRAALCLTLVTITVLFSLTACTSKTPEQQKSGDAITMEQAAKANTVKSLLERYETVTYSQLDYIGGITMHVTYAKDKSGNVYSVHDDYAYTGYFQDWFEFSRENGESKYEISAMKESAGVSDYQFVAESGEFTSQTLDANGNRVCTAETVIDQEYADYLSKSWGKVTTKDKLLSTTVFDAKDLHALSTEFSIAYENGGVSKIAAGVLLYDQDISYTDAVKDYITQEKVDVTVIFEDGTKRVSRIPINEEFTYICDEDYALYDDADGQQAYPEKSPKLTKSVMLYNLPKK